MKKPVALFLAAVFGASLVTGPHPCKTQHGEPATRHASCHAGAGASVPAHGSPVKKDCCDTFCQHACQMAAVTCGEPAVFALGLVAQAPVEAHGRGLPLVALPIDHIPLG